MSALAVEVAPLSTPCLQKRHSRCQLGEAMCSCACHTPEGLKVVRPKVEECETLRDACIQWMAAVEGEYRFTDEIGALCDYMRTNHNRKWMKWLDENASQMLYGYAQRWSNPHRGLTNRSATAPASVFGSAAEDFASGDARSLDYLSIAYVIDADNNRNALSALTYDDLTAPIDAYDKRAKANAMEAAYLRAIQKKLPKDNSKTVGDVFTNEQLQTLREAATQTA